MKNKYILEDYNIVLYKSLCMSMQMDCHGNVIMIIQNALNMKTWILAILQAFFIIRYLFTTCIKNSYLSKFIPKTMPKKRYSDRYFLVCIRKL